MSALLLIIVGAVIFLVIKKFPWDKDFQNSSTIIDSDSLVDSLAGTQLDGKKLFNSTCASCHIVGKDAVGPALLAVEERGPWKDSLKLYEYIRYPESVKDKYIDSLRKVYPTRHMGFPNLTDDEIKAILRYIRRYKPSVIVDDIRESSYLLHIH
ncbi:MAG: cytochrome c [Chitinophagaceae bacterium]|nr:cytochrome c [Chitinophagaceae bacterium]